MLATGAALVVAATAGLATLVLPDGSSPEVGDEPVGGSVSVEASDTNAPRDTLSPDPPTGVGGNLEVTGDRPGRFVVNRDAAQLQIANRFQTSGRFEVGDTDGNTLIFDMDPDSGLFIDQASYEGLNLFLDPEDCSFTVEEENDRSGIARLHVACPDVADVQGSAALTLEGTLDLPLRLAHPDGRYDSGGALVLEGDISAEMSFPSATWYLYPDDDQASAGDDEMPAISLYDDEAGHGLTLALDDNDQPYVTLIQHELAIFQPSPAGCSVTLQPDVMIAPHTELIHLDIECPSVTDMEGEVTVSITGSLAVHRQTIITRPLTPP